MLTGVNVCGDERFVFRSSVLGRLCRWSCSWYQSPGLARVTWAATCAAIAQAARPVSWDRCNSSDGYFQCQKVDSMLSLYDCGPVVAIKRCLSANEQHLVTRMSHRLPLLRFQPADLPNGKGNGSTLPRVSLGM